MKTFIKKENKGINMKFLLSFIVLVLTLFSVNAIDFTSDSSVQPEYFNSDVAIVEEYTIFGDDNFNYTINNESHIYDIRTWYSYMSNDIYIIYTNNIPNSSIEILLTPYGQTDPIMTTFNVTMESVGTYYMRLRPDYSGEGFRVEVNIPDGEFGIIKFAVTKNAYVENINSVQNTFISGMKDLVDIFIGFWKVMYYLFIFIIVISALALLIAFGFKIYDWADKLSQRKKRLLNGK